MTMDKLSPYFIKNPVIRNFRITHDSATCKEHLQVRNGLANPKPEGKGRGKST